MYHIQHRAGKALCTLKKKLQNVSLFAKGVNANLKQSYLFPNAHDLFEMYACNSSSKDCMVGDCPKCLRTGLSLSEFKEECTMITFFQWERIEKKIVKLSKSLQKNESYLNEMKQ